MSGKQVKQAIDRATIDHQDRKPRNISLKSITRAHKTFKSFDIQTGLECNQCL